jgi:tetratricopeptide (TPR) repeat protein
MEAPMKHGWGAWGTRVLVAGCLIMAARTGVAQRAPSAKSVEATRDVLIQKGQALESRGRPDLALQLWQQILLSEPNNSVALAGVARDYKLMGRANQAAQALDRLRAVNPNDPEISRIQSLSSTQSQNTQLQQAGNLARQGRAEDAMRIYRQLYGDHPPSGDIALAYYQTLYATANGKQTAIAGMRALAQQNPGDPRYAVALGTMLTYDARTRAEGIRILQQHPQDLDAQAALRQALVWNAPNPSSATELRQYLKAHPNDAEIAKALRQNESALQRMRSGIARTPEERAAFSALNAGRLDEAERRFSELLAKDPNNGRVVAGMGFLRMRQQNFGAAISYLEQAKADGYQAASVEDALQNSRFWYTMSEATQAFTNNQFESAQTLYRQALAMNPRSPEALNGLAGLYVKEQQYTQATGIYEQLLHARPNDADGWRGLFLAYARDGQNQKALATMARFPAPVKASMAKDPDYLRTLASIYQSEGRTAEAQRVLAQALALPFPGNGSTLQNDTRLQYAGILLQAAHYNQAVALYIQVLNRDPGNLAAWEGLISAHHNLGRDSEAINDVQRMPPATYESALADPGFLSMLGAIYQQANQYEVAQGFLERAERQELAAGGQPSIDLELQLASLDLLRNDPDHAYAIYRSVLSAHPDNAGAWQGLIDALQSTNRTSQALQQIAQMPAPVRKQLESNIAFVQTEASLYAASGDTQQALRYLKAVETHYAELHQQPPAGIDIQNAWLLYNTGDDRNLYPALMRIGGRTDLSLAQRETVETIWANWSVRRANQAFDNGNYRRAIDILDAARQAFPNNLAVRKAVAGGYVRVGRAKEALAIFKTVPMQDATSGDFQGAVGAALAANDRNQAEMWLRQALVRYPHDPAILTMAAQYEQARGDNERAAEYYRASLAAMPRVSPVDRLAHTLVYPEEDTRPHKAVTAADLQRLLNPQDEPFQKTVKLPPLPAYGPDPYNGTAPVVLQPSAQPRSNPVLNTPTSDMHPVPASDTSPVVVPIPNGALQAPVIFDRPAPVSSGGTGAAQLSASPAVAPQTQLSYSNVAIVPNPPHSLASDAYKGLVFSLMSGSRYAEALVELNKIPPDVRTQLESDIEFVQGIAGLYFAVGDSRRAQAYLQRVENYYLLHRGNVPVGLELQHAWLLYNLKDDTALYPVLLRLDARTDLTPAQRADEQNLWASWAIRRASDAMDRGDMIRGVEILQAASQDYPNNMGVRRAVAGAYARVGRASDALALYKAIPMATAAQGDFEGAVSAALAAGDMAQAEQWLRQAMARYPNDPQILGLAARFEQARGNNERASAFWRAALAAMPPGSAIKPLQDTVAYPPGAYQAPEPGDTRKLLDPRLDPLPTANSMAPLPAYTPQPANVAPPTVYSPPAAQGVGTQGSFVTSPSNLPLPLPGDLGAPPVVPNAAGDRQRVTAPSANPPAYVPQGASQAAPPNSPVLVEQSATQEALIAPATRKVRSGKREQNSNLRRYSGRMNLPASEAGVDSAPPELPPLGADSGNASSPLASSEAQPAVRPALPAGPADPGVNLRIESEPMGADAARAQAQFAEQTDGQLTQGSANVIHNLPNAPVTPLATANPAGETQYSMAQYTPSAQEAVTGAYSAPQQSQAPAPQAKPSPAPATTGSTRRRGRRRRSAARQNAQTLGSAPVDQNAQPLEIPPQQNPPAEATAPEQNPPADNGGLTDQELEERNLPPLRGPWVRTQRQAPALSPRDQAEMQLQAIESSYSGWLGGSTVLNHRSGNPGFDQLNDVESPFEASAPIGYHGRITLIAKPVFLDSGQADGNAISSVQESTISGSSLTTIPEPIGTLTTTNSTPPPQQNASGLGGELQLAFPQFAIAGGYTGYGFLVSTFTGRFYWKPGNGPFTFTATRDAVRDSQLSYSGLRDPAGTTLGTEGAVWGGVVYNEGRVQFGRGDAQSGYYFAAGGQYLTGYNVRNNSRFDGTGGAYWRAYAAPEYGTLSIGANFFAMHYANNQNVFTYGMGGYFSPQAYLLANVPFTWNGHYQTRWHYNVMGALGVQGFQQSAEPLWPLPAQKALETGQNNPLLPALTSVSANYDLRSQAAYQISPHWFAGGYFAANDTLNYNAASVGFFIRYLFREQPSTATAPTGLFPWDGMRPFSVP